MDSLKRENYSNYKVLNIGDNSIEGSTALEVNSVYEALQETVRRFGKRIVILLADGYMKEGALNKLNDLYQKQNIWMTYASNSSYVEITSFYGSIVDRLKTNDFQNKKQEKLNNDNFLVVSILELAKTHAYAHEQQYIYPDGKNSVLRTSNAEQ